MYGINDGNADATCPGLKKGKGGEGGGKKTWVSERSPPRAGIGRLLRRTADVAEAIF